MLVVEGAVVIVAKDLVGARDCLELDIGRFSLIVGDLVGMRRERSLWGDVGQKIMDINLEDLRAANLVVGLFDLSLSRRTRYVEDLLRESG